MPVVSVNQTTVSVEELFHRAGNIISPLFRACKGYRKAGHMGPNLTVGIAD
jgi:hypothetical protein